LTEAKINKVGLGKISQNFLKILAFSFVCPLTKSEGHATFIVSQVIKQKPCGRVAKDRVGGR